MRLSSYDVVVSGHSKLHDLLIINAGQSISSSCILPEAGLAYVYDWLIFYKNTSPMGAIGPFHSNHALVNF